MNNEELNAVIAQLDFQCDYQVHSYTTMTAVIAAWFIHALE